jgi:hypothetical protein
MSNSYDLDNDKIRISALTLGGERLMYFWIILVICVFLFFTETVSAQNQNEMFLSCDDAVARQDYVVSESLNALKNETDKEQNVPVLIVILRQSIGEKSQKLLKERIANLEQYFRDRGSRLKPQQVLVAVGPSVEGYGRIEYYIFGRLSATIYIRKNGFVCHECCGPGDRYYPHRKRAVR